MRYRLGAVLGQGGMAEVYDAELVGADGFRRRVALKRIRPEFAAEERFKSMFVDEARIASRLHHASIVGVVDYGLLDGLPYQVLELVEGEDLPRIGKLARERGQAIPIEVGVHICREVAYALDYAHRATGDDGRALGIVHRDVSPSNILCSWGGDVKLSDFGIALAHERRSQQTEIGVAKGKRSYMSPESLMGERVDGRADLFALGCVLHWFCTGRSPLSEPSAIGELIRRGKLELDPAIPEAVRPIIDRATRAERGERYPDGEAMGDALAEAYRQLSDRGGRASLRTLLQKIRPEGSDITPTYDREVAADPAASGPQAERTLVTRETVAAKTNRLAPAEEPHPSRRRAWPLWLMLVVVAAAGGAWVTMSGALGSDDPATPASAAGTPAPSDPRSETDPSPSPPAADDPAPGSTPEPPAAGHDDEEPPAGENPESPSTSDPGEHEARRSRRAARRTAPPAFRPTAAGTETGHLTVSGPGAVNHMIRVDGIDVVRAPHRIQLPLGTHRVELVDQSGQVVNRRNIELTADHGRSHPLRWNL